MATQAAQERPRRTQADRRRATRAKLLQAAITCIAESGYANTTLVDIAKAANLTKGAIQHHFADKRELDIAVMFDSFRKIVNRLERIKPGATLTETVDAAVDGMYEAWASPAARAAIELTVAYRGDHDLLRSLPPFYSPNTLHEIWRQVFSQVSVSDKRVLECYHLVYMAVRGQISLETPWGDQPNFALLKTALIHLLTIEEKPAVDATP